jgi:hypothetical protein
VSDTRQEVDRERRSGNQQLAGARACEVIARGVRPGQQATVLDQVQAIERGKAPAGALAAQDGRRSPEHRQPRVERGALGLLPVRNRLNGLGVAGMDRIAHDQADVDIAHELAEAAVGQAAERVDRDEPVAERHPTGGSDLSEDDLGHHRPDVSDVGRRRR